MTSKARTWIGITLLLILLFNYLVIGFPMIKRSAYLKNKTKATLLSQVKSGKAFENSEDAYMLEILKREKAHLDRKVLVLNCVAATLLILIASWTAFGVLFHRKK